MDALRKTIWSAMLVGTVGAESFLVQPGFVGGFVDHLHLTIGDAGFVASGDMFGMAAMSFLIPLLTRFTGWRRLLWISALAIIAGNATSMALTSPVPLFCARLLAGLGYGGFVSLSFAAMGMAENQDRTFGYYIMWCMAYGAAGLFLMPLLLGLAGLDGAFGFFILLPLCTLPFLHHFPNQGEAAPEGPTGQKKAAAPVPIWLSALASIFVYFLAQGAVWAYLDRIGVAGGLDVGHVDMALAICSIAGILGALVAVKQAARFGRLIPLSTGIAGSILSLAFLVGHQALLPYAIATCLFNFAWNYANPYLLAVMADLDHSGRLVIWTAGLQTLGLAFGPPIAGRLVSATNYLPVNFLAGGLFALSLALVAPAAIMTIRRLRTVQG